MEVRVTFLGAGDAFGSGGNCMAGYLVEAAGTTLLLDCGPTSLLSMKRHHISAEAIDAVILSHFHGDHFAGLPFLFLELISERPRRRPLRIAGPPGTEARVRGVFRAMYRETASRPLPFPVEFIDLPPGRPQSLCGAAVLPFQVPHQQRDISLGLRLHLAGRVLVYSGDSGWTEELVEQTRDSDLFICECSFFETRTDNHLDYPRIAENRDRLGCRRLVLTHLGREVLARREEISEELASDGLVVTL